MSPKRKKKKKKRGARARENEERDRQLLFPSFTVPQVGDGPLVPAGRAYRHPLGGLTDGRTDGLCHNSFIGGHFQHQFPFPSFPFPSPSPPLDMRIASHFVNVQKIHWNFILFSGSLTTRRHCSSSSSCADIRQRVGEYDRRPRT